MTMCLIFFDLYFVSWPPTLMDEGVLSASICILLARHLQHGVWDLKILHLPDTHLILGSRWKSFWRWHPILRWKRIDDECSHQLHRLCTGLHQQHSRNYRYSARPFNVDQRLKLTLLVVHKATYPLHKDAVCRDRLRRNKHDACAVLWFQNNNISIDQK